MIACVTIALITLPFHAIVTEYNDWRHIEQNNTVVQRDGLWTSCVKTKEGWTECEPLAGDVFETIHSANVLAFISMFVNVVAGVTNVVYPSKYKNRMCISSHMFTAFSVMIMWILFLLDTYANRSDDKKYTLQWCFYLAIATSVLEFIAVFLLGFNLRFLRRWDLDQMKKSIEKKTPVEKSPPKRQPSKPQQPKPLQPKPQTPTPQTRQLLIGFQQFQHTEASNRHQSSSDKPQDQTIPMVLTIHPISVVRKEDQNMPEVQQMQLISVVPTKDQTKPDVQQMQLISVVPSNNQRSEVQPKQFIPVVQLNNIKMPVVQPMQLISVVPSRDRKMPEVQPKQFISKVQRKGPHYNVLKILMKE